MEHSSLNSVPKIPGHGTAAFHTNKLIQQYGELPSHHCHHPTEDPGQACALGKRCQSQEAATCMRARAAPFLCLTVDLTVLCSRRPWSDLKDACCSLSTSEVVGHIHDKLACIGMDVHPPEVSVCPGTSQIICSSRSARACRLAHLRTGSEMSMGCWVQIYASSRLPKLVVPHVMCGFCKVSNGLLNMICTLHSLGY